MVSSKKLTDKTNNLFFSPETSSTNILLWQKLHEEKLPEGFVVYTDFQTAGKGQVGNSWESAAGENILFSLLLYPQHIAIEEHFLISQITSIGIKKMLDNYISDVTIKWPNDIYWKEKKLAGILVETSLQNRIIKSAVIGVGLNVNQKKFLSDAPNPVSLFQILGKKLDRQPLMNSIVQNLLDIYYHWDNNKIRSCYQQFLYRKEGYHLFEADKEVFSAKIVDVLPTGQIELATKEGVTKKFYFKEVKYL